MKLAGYGGKGGRQPEHNNRVYLPPSDDPLRGMWSPSLSLQLEVEVERTATAQPPTRLDLGSEFINVVDKVILMFTLCLHMC